MSTELSEPDPRPSVDPAVRPAAHLHFDGADDADDPAVDGKPDPSSRAAADARQKRRTLALRRREWVALGVLLFFVLLFGANFKLARVVGSSMEPTFHNGQLLLVWRTAGIFSSYKVGDVIVFRAPDGRGELIKRIAFIQKPDGSARMPEALWTVHGMIPVPALLMGTRHYTFPGYMQEIEDARAGIKVKKTIFVMGDNTWGSEDSRIFGPVDPDTILGEVVRYSSQPAPRK